MQKVYDWIGEMRRLLGDRLLTVSDGGGFVQNTVETRKQAYKELKDTLNKKSIVIPRNASVSAYGQAYGECIPTIASNFREEMQLENPVTIEMYYTNVGVRKDEKPWQTRIRLVDIWEQDKEHYQEKFSGNVTLNPFVPGLEDFDPSKIRLR